MHTGENVIYEHRHTALMKSRRGIYMSEEINKDNKANFSEFTKFIRKLYEDEKVERSSVGYPKEGYEKLYQLYYRPVR